MYENMTCKHACRAYSTALQASCDHGVVIVGSYRGKAEAAGRKGSHLATDPGEKQGYHSRPLGRLLPASSRQGLLTLLQPMSANHVEDF